MQYCRAPRTQRLMYSSTVTASKSMANRTLSIGDCSDTSPKKLVLSKIHSLVVKNCSNSNPSLIFLVNRTMLQTNTFRTVMFPGLLPTYNVFCRNTIMRKSMKYAGSQCKNKQQIWCTNLDDRMSPSGYQTCISNGLSYTTCLPLSNTSAHVILFTPSFVML